MTNKGYTAYSYAGGEETNLTLDQAREQVRVWEEKGYRSYVGKDDDPEWEDLPEQIPTVGVAKAFSPEFVFSAIGPDPKTIERFAFDLLELNGQELDFQDGAVVVYDRGGEE